MPESPRGSRRTGPPPPEPVPFAAHASGRAELRRPPRQAATVVYTPANSSTLGVPMRFIRLAVLCSLCSSLASPLAAQDGIFSDGFEAGNHAAWDPPTYCPAISTFTLTAPGAAVDAWTVPAAQKVLTTDLPPAASSGTLRLFAARNEFEPLVVALHPPAADASLVSATLAPFAGLGAGATIDLRQATYTGDRIEALQPLIARTLHPAEAPLVLWATIYVPADAPPGLHTSTLTVDFSNRPDVVVPVELYVFNALLPPAATFQSQLPVELHRSGGRQEAVALRPPPDAGDADLALRLPLEHHLGPGRPPSDAMHHFRRRDRPRTESELCPGRPGAGVAPRQRLERRRLPLRRALPLREQQRTAPSDLLRHSARDRHGQPAAVGQRRLQRRVERLPRRTRELPSGPRPALEDFLLRDERAGELDRLRPRGAPLPAVEGSRAEPAPGDQRRAQAGDRRARRRRLRL